MFSIGRLEKHSNLNANIITLYSYVHNSRVNCQVYSICHNTQSQGCINVSQSVTLIWERLKLI